MVNVTVNGILACVPENTTILDCARSLGIKIPTLCYLKEINEVGACKMCVVEIEGNDRLVSSCNTIAEDGMVIYTDSDKVKKARLTNLNLILSEHDYNCSSCNRKGNCTLEDLAKEYSVYESVSYNKKIPKNRWDASDILLKEESKCIKCLRCADVCKKVQSLSVWELNGSGNNARVAAKSDSLSTACSLCGQCVTHCPTGAIYSRDDTEKFINAISDPEKIVVAQIAPAVRTAWAEEAGVMPSFATEKRMVSAMKALGADFVFDTNFSADLTIMEEASEFIERFTHKDKYPLPMFTSCCPGWVRFVKLKYPEICKNLSSAKSPQQMFGAVAKSYFAEKLRVSPENIFCVSVMPCTAKKYECNVSKVNSASSRDVDISLTTREFNKLLKDKKLDIKNLPETEFDSPLGESSGAGVIFGSTGGVMEAAVRTAYYMLLGTNPDPDMFKEIRSKIGVRELSADIGGNIIKLAVASGLGEAEKIISAIKSKEADYDFVEIMACPGGCSGGGGQPITDGLEPAISRGKILYDLDRNRKTRFSHENENIRNLYSEYLGKPLSEKSHMLLHTSQDEWEL